MIYYKESNYITFISCVNIIKTTAKEFYEKFSSMS